MDIEYMPVIPPAEIPALRTFHLGEGVVIQQKNQRNLPRFSLSGFSLPKLEYFGAALLLGLALPAGVVFAIQSRPPELSSAEAQETTQYLAQQKQTNQPLVAQTNPGANSGSASANLVSTNTGADGFHYYFSLSNGFLKKAVDLSQSSAGKQTESDKQDIKNYLDEALKDVNQAITLDSKQGSAYLLRARIYKTASVIDPSLSSKGDADLQMAKTLGVDATLINSDANPADYLPTEQASKPGGPIIAGADEGNSSSVSANTNSNAEHGEVVLQKDTDSVYVVFPQLSSGKQLTVQAKDPSNEAARGLRFTISSRKEGKGFTITSSGPTLENITLEWQAASL